MTKIIGSENLPHDVANLGKFQIDLLECN